MRPDARTESKPLMGEIITPPDGRDHPFLVYPIYKYSSLSVHKFSDMYTNETWRTYRIQTPDGGDHHAPWRERSPPFWSILFTSIVV